MARPLGFLCFAAHWLIVSVAFAQTAPTRPEVRPIPPPGIAVPAPKIDELKTQLAKLDETIAALQKRRDAKTPRFLPDVQIFSIAVHRAIEGNTFYGEKDPDHAVELLKTGQARAEELLKGTHSWTSQPGLIVRGYLSRIDGSVQPYGLVIGDEWKPDDRKPVRCDIWFRGRSEKGLELQFIYDRMHGQGEYQLKDGIVLHPFGRYCNANRFAGEVDVFEALDHAKGFYKIDDDRISVRGFSMGGAACWGFTVHYPDRWFASNPGAGFSDTKRFLSLDKKPADQLPPPYARQLWTLYDADVLADNLYDVNVIAYSGEIDGQKLAADIMVEAAARRGIEFLHIIGPQTAHKLHLDSKKIIAEKMDEWAREGRSHQRSSIRFCTFTLKYNKCDWITLNGLQEHWQEAFVDGDVIGDWGSAKELKLKTRNTTDFTIDFADSKATFSKGREIAVSIDDKPVSGVRADANGKLAIRFQKNQDDWKVVSTNQPAAGKVKKHNLQGPVDDALMDSFLFVEPTGEFMNPQVKTWVQSEMTRAAKEWKNQMRGEVRTKKDTELTPEDIKNNNLILWGCPKSNQFLAKVAEDLPIGWTHKGITAGDQKFDAAQHALIAIYPNPQNPERYIVLNSGITFRENDYLNNAMQTPKLPDWAVVDLAEAPSKYAPGKIVAADFFNEQWKLKTAK